MRIGVLINGGAPLNSVVSQVMQAEEAGFASAWLPNIFANDALTALALAGARTSRIELGTAVVPTFPRHPSALAQQALTVQAATAGRLTLGIGLSHKPVIEQMMGLDFSKPVRHMREYLAALTALLSGKPANVDGDVYRIHLHLTVPGAPPPPVLVAALGPQMLQVAGRMAAGTITWMGGPTYLAQDVVPVITAAAQEAGKPAPRIVAGFPIAVTDQVEAARDAARRVFSVYATLPSYRAILDREGAADAAGVAIIGNEQEVAAQIARLADGGVTDLNCAFYPIAEDPDVQARSYATLARLAKLR